MSSVERRTSNVERRASDLERLIDEIGSATRTVTKVVVQKKRQNRVSVFVDDEFAFGVSDEVAALHKIRAGSQIDRVLLQSLYRDGEMADCKRIAMRYISYRMRSAEEVRRRLAKEDAGPQVVDSVVSHLHEIGLLDDEAFAKAYARDAALGRKWGPHRIAKGLRLAGVGKADIEAGLAEVRHVLEDEGIVETLAAKRWNQLSGVDDVKKRKKRVYDYLLRRGFDFDVVRRVVGGLGK